MFWFSSPFFFVIPILFAVLVVQGGLHIARRGRRYVRRRWRLPWDEGEDRFLEDHMSDRGSAAALEARVFRLAHRGKGRLTVSDVVVEMGLSVADAEELLQGMVDNVRVRMEVRENGVVVYEFPELLDRFES